MVSKAKAAAAAAAEERETAEQRAARLERARLRDAAAKQGMLSSSRRVCQHPAPPSKLLQRANGKDIVKKSSVRKNRFMLVFNVSITPKAGGKLGTLKKLDTQTPVMYMDFPEGRLKFFGTLIFPRNKYIMMRIGNRDILCEDIFESMVVFSEVWWVGTAEENPEERKLDMPASVAERRLHENDPVPPVTEEGVPKEEESEQGDKDEVKGNGGRVGKPMRAAAKGALKALCGEESEDLLADDEEDSEGGSYDGVGVIGKRNSQDTEAISSGATGERAVGKKGGTIQSLFAKAATKTGTVASRSAGGGVGSAEKGKRKAATTKRPTPKPTPAMSRKRKPKAESDSDKDDDYMMEAATQGSQPQSVERPKRRAAAKQVKYDTDLDSDDLEDEDSDEE